MPTNNRESLLMECRECTKRLGEAEKRAGVELCAECANTACANDRGELPPSLPDLDDEEFLQKVRRGQDFATTGKVRRVLGQVPVRKPKKSQFIRCHPRYYVDGFLLEYDDGNGDQQYLVMPTAYDILAEHVAPCIFALAQTRHGGIFIWPIKVPHGDRPLAWHKSGLEAFEYAKHNWCNVKANLEEGQYEFGPPERTLPEKPWPEHSFGAILKKAFDGRIIDSEEHTIVQQLLGRE